MAPFDPVAEYGSKWREFRDGSVRRVVILQGRYHFELKDTKGSPRYVPIEDAIAPPDEAGKNRADPRTPGQLPSQQSRDSRGQQSQFAYHTQYDAQIERSPVPAQATGPTLDDHLNPGLPSPPGRHGQYALAGGQSTLASATRPYTTEYDNEVITSNRALQFQPNLGRSTPIPNDSALGLSDVALQFARIGLGQFATCGRFVEEHRRIRETNANELVNASIEAERQGRRELSNQCIQRGVIIRACKNLSSRARTDYFKELAKTGSRDSNEFSSQCRQVEERVRLRVHDSARASEVPGSTMSGARAPESDRYETGAYPAPLPTQTSHDGYQPSYQASYQASYQPRSGAEETYDSPPSALPTDRGANYSIIRRDSVAYSTRFPRTSSHGDNEDEDDFGSGEQRQQQRYHGTPASRPQGAQRRPSNKGSRGSRPYDQRTVTTAQGGEKADFRGGRQPDVLDPSYEERQAWFFTKGRIFAMIWHENLGSHHGKTSTASDKHVSIGFSGEMVYSNIRRMVVVRQRQGYCVVVPILSYGEKGVKKAMPRSEKQAHAIIYKNGHSIPTSLPGEPEFTKRPIAADMRRGETLWPSSRIHFGKHHTVEYNVKVKDIGNIAEISRAELESYFRQESFEGHGRD
ncbi:hypothetical protein EDD36DRAFT_97255 [Exophiala viscosa]|uniref:Uncharacterized protein n=1 Tax=Exophiala viscosa TaxID=2486360 RepID=A0AAN6I941_9EURO|nr:hypothetical protein EDD36DRAFT_97255 [Exophiala viscosa]